MNKKELIKKIKEMPVFATTISKISLVRQCEVLKLIEQLNQAEEVKVPQVAIDYIKHAKDNDWGLQDVFNSTEYFAAGELSEWFYEEGNMDLLARYCLDCHTVEKEKRYIVKAKGVCFNSCLIFEKTNKTWLFSSIYETDHQRGHHTRKELEEAGFGDMFNSPLFEVEEVEG